MMNNDNDFKSRVCPRCGTPARNDDVFCGECGTNLENPAMPPEYPNAVQTSNTVPLSALDFLLMLLLFSIPLVGLILMLVWSFSGAVNINRRNFSRAFLIYYAAILLASVLCVFLFYSIFSAYTGF